MRNNNLLSCILIALSIQLLTSFQGFGQKFSGGIDFHAFADNREYHYIYQYPQTIFGMRVTPYIARTLDSVHYFRVGVNALYEFGGEIKAQNFTPEIYYNYRGRSVDFKFGAFPRRENLSDYSLLLLTDTLMYFRPAIQGLMTTYKRNNLNLKVWVDWVSRQTATHKEQFLFGLTARYRSGPFFAEDQFSMLHDAFASVRHPDDVLHDNGANIFRLGFDANVLKLDKLMISFGLVSGYERARALGQLKTPAGFLNEVRIEKKWFVLKNTFYAGEGFSQTFGDKFYRSKKYNRSDISVRFFGKSKVTCLFTYSLHRIGKQWDNQQALQLFAGF